jgi:hypothetical protein
MKKEQIGRIGRMTVRRLVLDAIVVVGIALLFPGTLAGCGGSSRVVTGRGSLPADGKTAPGGTSGAQLMLFTSPG